MIRLAIVENDSGRNDAGGSGKPVSRDEVTILVVEDDADMGEVMELILEPLGFKTLLAQSVREAVEVASGKHLGLVISDLGLPGESGLKLPGALGCIGKVPAISLSGYSSDADIRASREAGFVEHLVKPVTPEKLLEVVRRMLKV